MEYNVAQMGAHREPACGKYTAEPYVKGRFHQWKLVFIVCNCHHSLYSFTPRIAKIMETNLRKFAAVNTDQEMSALRAPNSLPLELGPCRLIPGRCQSILGLWNADFLFGHALTNVQCIRFLPEGQLAGTSIQDHGRKITSVLNGSSFTATHVRAGLGSGTISRTVLKSVSGMWCRTLLRVRN